MNSVLKNNVQSIERALMLLEALAENSDGCSLKILSAQTGLNKSTAHRILHTMMDYKFIHQDPETEKYYLGTRILYLSNRLMDSLDIRTIASPYLKELCKSTGETVHLLVIRKDSAVYIDKVENPQRAIRMYSMIGKNIPLYCSSGGKAILAWMPENDVRQILGAGPLKRFTDTTTTSLDALFNQFKDVRQHGFATDWFEHEESVFCLAAPIFDNKNMPVAAVSIAGTPLQFNINNYNMFCADVNQTARAISERLGCVNYPAIFRPMPEEVYQPYLTIYNQK